jgi:predicted permease
MPDWKPELQRRLAGLGLARSEEIVEELAQHLEDHYAEAIRSGLGETEARAQALQELASEAALRRALRSVEPEPMEAPPTLGAPPAGRLMGLGDDLRYALRGLRSRPGLAAVALATLALGIGANVAIFSAVNAALLRPLPFVEPDRLVYFWGTSPEKGLPVVNYPDALYDHYRRRSRSVAPLAFSGRAGFTLTGYGDAEWLNAANVTVDYFKVLGVAPWLGRTFLPEEEKRGNNLVALLSYGLWQRRFSSDPSIVGRAIELNGIATTVVGVMPRGFDFPDKSELWVPLGIDPQSTNCWCYLAIGRLAPGLVADDVGREIDALNDDFFVEREGRPRRPEAERRRATVVVPVAEHLVGDVKGPMLLMLGAVAVVLLIACANVANLLLERALSRSREIAVRACLGASPWRVLRQLLVESLVLASLGGAGGLALAALGMRLLEPLVLERLPYLDRVGWDPAVLLFTLAVSAATAVLFGVAPALRGAQVDLHEAIREGARGSRGAGSRRLNDAFVVAQVALSLVLLVTAGLLLRSFAKLTALETGFRAERVLVGRVSLPGRVYRELAQIRALHGQLVERVAGLPGVVSVAASSTAPFSTGNNQQAFVVQGQEPAPGQPVLVTSLRSVTPKYFAAVGTPLLRGRVFEESDADGKELVAVVDESLARRHWPDGNALGRKIRIGGPSSNPWRTIVGVVAAIKHRDLSRRPDHYVYTPFAQDPRRTMDLVVRAAREPESLAAGVRAELKALDPALPMFEVHTLEQAVSDSLRVQRLLNGLLIAFALVAVLLAAIGIYGVVSLSVRNRTSEFGIRLALGATPGGVRRLVLGQGLRLSLLGAALGLAAAAALTRHLGALLFGVAPLDPGTFASVTLALVGVALAAGYVPARRVTRLDPLQSLRCE